MVSGWTLFPGEAGSLSSERLWSCWWGDLPAPQDRAQKRRLPDSEILQEPQENPRSPTPQNNPHAC